MRQPTFHKDPYCRRLTTQVMACRPRGDVYLAVTADTLLFPGGGGQPPDHGTLDGQPVLQVEQDRDGGWIHSLGAPAEPGPCELELDWTRRFDHMQQHSAQHLVTALAQDQYGLTTCAFHLGSQQCSIDLDSEQLEPEILAELQALVNAEVRAALPISARLLPAHALARLSVRTRGLPPEHEGPVRVVTIEGVDVNTCGGTHLATTAELQLVRLLGTDRVHGGNTRLHFLSGGRAMARFHSALERERALTRSLASPPSEHLAAVAKLNEQARATARGLRRCRAELAAALGRGLAGGSDPVAVLHRPLAGTSFLQAVANAAFELDDQRLLFLTAGEGSAGRFLLAGDPDTVARLGPKVAAALVGRGGGARGRYQGNCEEIDGRHDVLAMLVAEISAGSA